MFEIAHRPDGRNASHVGGLLLTFPQAYDYLPTVSGA
jgi:hypothetical protein